MNKKMNVSSFNLDHTKVVAPYIRLAETLQEEKGDVVYKYDIRFMQPNKAHIEMKAMHSLEHLIAEYIRNHNKHVVDFSPMGCQTGFYLSLSNVSSVDTVIDLLHSTLQDVLKATEVPAANEKQCGWAEHHDLKAAQDMARYMLSKKQEWKQVFGNN